MRRAEHSGRALLLVILGLVVGGVLFRLATGALAPGPDTLRVSVGALRSSLAEALLLTAAGDAGRLTRAFRESELDRLRRDVESLAGDLGTARPEPALRARYAEAAALAAAGAAGLRALGARDSPPESLIAAQSTLAERLLQSEELEREIAP